MAIRFEPVGDKRLQLHAEWLQLDPIDHLLNEGINEEAAGCLLRYSARAQVEQRLVVQLTDRGTVCALYVVGVNFEPRSSIDLGMIGENQVLVLLVGIGAIGTVAHHESAVEHAVPTTLEYTLIQLVAGAMVAT